MQIKLPNWDNFDDQLIPRLIQDYRVLKKPTDFFFSYEGAVIKFSDVDTLLKNQITNQNIWLYLLIYLLNLSYAQHHHRPFIRFIIIEDSKPVEQKQAIAYQELTEMLNQDTSIEYDRHIMLIKLRYKYFGVINQYSKTYLLNYSNLKQQDITYILEQTALFELQELIVVNKYIKDDSSHLLFKHMGQSILGQKLETISLSEYDSEKCMRRLVWTVIQTGFNEIDRLFQLNLQMEDEDKQQQILQYQQDKLKEQIKQGRGKAFEDKTDRIRLKTPVTQEEYEKQMQYLNERISHLKMLNGDGNSNDVLMSQMFQIRIRDLESKIDQEFHNLDNLKQQQLTFKNSSLPLLRNASEILKGNFHEGLFKGLGLDLKPQNLSRDQVLTRVKEHNFNTIQKPLLEYNNDKQVIPGVFIKANVNRLLAYRYDIQDLCTEYKLNYYFQKLELFDELKDEHQSGRNTLNKEYMKNQLVKYDKIIFPIRCGYPEEVSIGIIDVPNLRIHHYYLYQIKQQETQKGILEIKRQWNLNNDVESVNNIRQQRRSLQDECLQIMIYWIKQQARFNRLQNFHDMRLWKIRLEDVNQTSSIQNVAIYLMSFTSHMAMNKPVYDNLNKLSIVKSAIEHIICTSGVGKQDRDVQGFKYLMTVFNS